MNQDPLFEHFNGHGDFRPYLYESPKINHNVVCVYGDGFNLDAMTTYQQSQKLLVTHYQLISGHDPYQKNIHVLNPKYYGIFFQPWQDVDHYTITRDYNLLINRFDIFRQSWLYHMVRNAWLDRGFVSFNCALHSLPDASYQGLTPYQCFEKGFIENNQIFSAEHAQIRDKIPFKNFQEVANPISCVLQSKFSIVLETWFHDNRIIGFTEKTMRVLQLPRPWLLFSTRSSVQMLKDWGFDVLDDLIDHSYDTLDDPVARQMKILSVARELLDIDISKVYQRCRSASLHNQNILQQWHRGWIDNMIEECKIIDQKAKLLLSQKP